MNKKKSAPGGTQIPEQDYGTTPERKSEAEILFDKIGTGVAYAVRRPRDPKVDRKLRKLIADACMNGDDCIINDGSGYFRPGEDDEIAFATYCAAERHKAWEILHRINRMEDVFERRYQSGNI